MTLWKKVSDKAAMATGDFARLFGSIDVPALPQVALKVIELGRQEDVELHDVAEVVSSDAGVALKILRTINSAQFSLPERVTDIRRAVAHLGVGRVQSLALAYSMADALPKQAAAFDSAEFWQASLQQATFARALCTQMGTASEGEAFTGALLQNMTLPILLSHWSEHYEPVMRQAQAAERPLHEVENDQLGWNHAQAGSWMARNWGLPDALVCCIGLHHATMGELADLGLSETHVLPVAVSARLPEVEPILRADLHLNEAKIQSVFESTDQACAELATLFDVKPPRPLSPDG